MIRFPAVGSTPDWFATVSVWPVSFQRSITWPLRPAINPHTANAAVGPAAHRSKTPELEIATLLPLARLVDVVSLSDQSPLFTFVPVKMLFVWPPSTISLPPIWTYWLPPDAPSLI